jgi:peptide chain release factor subunit 1
MMLADTLTRLADFKPTGSPVLSLYLNTQPDQHGRDHFHRFLRKEFADRLRTYPARSTDRESLEHDITRINTYVDMKLERSANGVAIFACHAADGFFEALQLAAPIDENRLYVDRQPHLYPLARLDGRYPRYAVLLTNTNAARLYVVGDAEILSAREVINAKVPRPQVGGWSQARYQRHADNFHAHHIREVVDVLDFVVRTEAIERILLAGDDVALPLLRNELTPQLAKLVVDVLRLDIATPEHELLHRTLDVMREQDARSDEDKARAAVDSYRSGGLGVVGVPETMRALELGQVDELLVTDLRAMKAPGMAAMEPLAVDERLTEEVAEKLVARAAQTSARVTVIDDPSLLALVGGVAGLLRFRVMPGKGSPAPIERRSATVTTGR